MPFTANLGLTLTFEWLKYSDSDYLINIFLLLFLRPFVCFEDTNFKTGRPKNQQGFSRQNIQCKAMPNIVNHDQYVFILRH